MNGSDIIQQYVGNATAPPENFRFIPGWTPSLKNNNTNITSIPTGRTPVFNGTGYYIDDEVEPGLNDLQTLFLACFATLAPLIVTLLTAFGIRFLWKKFAKRQPRCTEYDGVLHTEENTEAIQRPLHSHLFNSDKMKSNETTHISIGTEDVEVCDETGTINSGSLRGNHSSTNGSIITMTLKNNHLIVETEERNDIEEDSRETTMKYSPSARDGVFVVEVQQGVRRSPNASEQPKDVETSVSISNQCALVHNPPDRYSDEEVLEEGDENYYVETTSLGRDTPDSLINRIRTGLSQSNVSLSSTGPNYCYGNQQGYDTGTHGYPLYYGYLNDDAPQRLESVNNKPKITSAVYKNRAFSKGSIDVLVDGPLLSDLYVTDPIQEEQTRLGNTAINLNVATPKTNGVNVDTTTSNSNVKVQNISKKNCDKRGEILSCNVNGNRKELSNTTRNDTKDVSSICLGTAEVTNATNIKIDGPNDTKIDIDKKVDVQNSEGKKSDKLENSKLNAKDAKS